MKIIILKFDDFRCCTKNWEIISEYVVSKNIKASIGIIGRSLETENQISFDWVKNLNSAGNFEFWNHGYNHKNNKDTYEFYKTSYEEQYKSIETTQRLGKNKLGITFSTFGAPYNKMDDNTTLVLEKFSDIKICFSRQKCCNSKLNLHVFRGDILNESKHLSAKFDQFISRYNPIKYKECNILQFHPQNWRTSEDMVEFKKIIDYLTLDPEIKFMTPTEFLNYNANGLSV
jgi:hypothetical protein